ncbi:efflux transporter outer membrane subunit [Pannonibacter phragmitetus]|uniref:efflux transporter outer membrane subunit n=1 Tax=Pannonibacter phragmitetus TaxID=121719 RepID=UPI000F02C5F2|nr:efflux transporter outer membrane subunit [Pannonibacter phragmitetus]
MRSVISLKLSSSLFPDRNKRRKIALPLLLSVSALLAGCAVGPDYASPQVTLSGAYSNSAGKDQNQRAELARWWERLGDPVLNQLIETAIRQNLDLATAKAKVREARASYAKDAGGLLPSANGSGSASRSRSSGDAPKMSNLFQAGVDASWEVDLFGANARTAEASRYGLDAAEEDLRATMVTLIGDITTYYAQARAYQARVALARRTASSQTETVRLTQSRFDAGAVSAADVANATGQASTTEANIPSLQISYAESLHRLGVLTGGEPASLASVMTKTRPIPRPKLPLPVGVPADLLNSRPDLKVLERKLAQATASIGAAEAARYPAISLTGNISTSAAKTGDLAKNSSISWSFGPTLSVPLFNGGSLAAAADVARAQRDASFLAYRKGVLEALEEVENALVSLSRQRQRTGKLVTAANAYRQAADIARSQYQGGSSSFLDVLDAERSLYSAEDTLITSQLAIVTAYISLNRSLGGGWDGAVDTATPAVVDVRTGPHLRKLAKDN